MSLTAGKMLSHYRLVAKCGEGGMGVVWKAEDTVLDRTVAVKVLPEAVAKNPERRARLEREAKLLASLNHPNIAAIHGLEDENGVRFLVMEFVPGETLEEALRRGPFPADETLAVCRQIAEALEAAHESAVIHRDLKPANVVITPEGKVKVLDFGLAKAFETDRPAGGMSQSPTITTGGTKAGLVLGTAAYMSPEQARGKPLDRRTDIWSFGCVLFELFSGRAPFHGDTVSDTIAEILKQEPDWRVLPASAPQTIRKLIRRCLHKDPQRRLQHIGDARIEIEEVQSGESDPDKAAAPTRRGNRAILFGAAVLVAVAAFLGAWIDRAAFRSAGSISAKILEVVQAKRLTHDSGLSEGPTWSPDGRLLAFASNRSGNFEIYVRPIDGGQDVNITNHPAQEFQPAYSPDGKRVAFISTRSSRTGMIKIGSTAGIEIRTYGGDLWVTPTLGGQARRLAPDANFPTWLPDGRKIVYISGAEYRRSIIVIGADGGSPETILPSDASTWEILRVEVSPGGKWISFETLSEEIYLLPSGGGEARKIIDGLSHVWDPSGSRLFFLGRSSGGGNRIQTVRIDEDSGNITGTPRSLSLLTGLLRDLAISRDGTQLAGSGLEGSRNLTLLPLDEDGSAPSGPEEILTGGQVIDHEPNFSPDGRHIAFISNRLGPADLWVLDLETRKQDRLLLPGAGKEIQWPSFSPDGAQMSVTRFLPDGTAALWLVAVDGSQAEELLAPGTEISASSFSRDGKTILYSARIDGNYQVFSLDLASRETRQLTTSPGNKQLAYFSPDGRWITFPSNPHGPVQIWRMPAEGGPEEQLTTGEERNLHSFYSPDGKWLYFQPSHRNIYRMPADGGPAVPVTTFPESGLYLEEPLISPDGRYLAYCRSNSTSSLWLFTLKMIEKPEN